ncbi:ribosome biogenesis factor YjgA [Thiolinea disciformis]|uniref:ribosome biogenesis factor YjgA n=1 Tax=Thiolinea disciformis TaxID=125614 RepID=UPI00037C41CF|nr:ribosome biogenesis factor YjgA [Thiolinea disciformis]
MKHDYDDDEAIEIISKGQTRREAEALQVLGEKLIELPHDKLVQLDLPEKLLDAVIEAKRLTAHGALRRQRQYIGKLMRQVEPEPIQAKFNEWENQGRVEIAKFHRLEQWRDKLIADEEALGKLMQDYAEVDVQHVRNLIRNARKEASLQKAPKSSRELFQYLKNLST